MTKKPTIDDVAALSGVARTTVSRVLNNGPNVRPAMREKVLAAVRELNYTVNPQARSLAGGGNRQIALVHASDLDREPNSYYHSGLELGALRACVERGYQLTTHTINQTQADFRERVYAIITRHQCDGIILPPPFSDDLELLNGIKARECPLTCISAGEAAQMVAPSVGINDEAAGHMMGAHLAALGHQRFAFIQGIEGHVSAEQRLTGFRRALKEANIDANQPAVLRGDFTFRSGIDCANVILERHGDVTAIVCANDDMAAGALLTLHRCDIAVPEQISVTGFDDTPMSEIIWPPLTTIHQPIRTIAHHAVESVINQIEGNEPGKSAKAEMVSFRLVARQSSAAVSQSD